MYLYYLKLNKLLPVFVIAIAALMAFLMVQNHDEPERKQPEKIVPLVNVQTIHTGNISPNIEVFGEVIPKMDVVIRSQVAGSVLSVNGALTLGGRLQQGDQLVAIDPTDYELSLAQRKANVASARLAHEQELGQQEIARKEWELFVKSNNANNKNSALQKRLAFREPQLHEALANLEAAESALKRAQLDLDRTVIRAPFDSFVLSENSEIGQVVSGNSELCRLVGTESFYITASIARSLISTIQVTQGEKEGAPVQVIVKGSGKREGYVTRVLPNLDQKSRMAKVLIAVDDPLSLLPENNGKTELLIGDFVELNIQAKPLTNAARIPRSYLRDNNTVWLYRSGVLEITPVDVVFREKDAIIISGIANNEIIISSPLSVFTQGMAVRMVESNGT